MYSCTNRTLYIICSLSAMAACAYTFLRGDVESWQQIVAGVGMVAVLIWGGYYALLRWVVDEQGVSRCLLGRQSLTWDEVRDIELQEKHLGESESCSITFHAADGRSLRLSSELISLERMHELRDQLIAEGRLPASAKAPASNGGEE